jgi:pimeloyl-ACP methyl ester carboxylesterase
LKTAFIVLEENTKHLRNDSVKSRFFVKNICATNRRLLSNEKDKFFFVNTGDIVCRGSCFYGGWQSEAVVSSDVASIQAYTDMCFYGQKLTQVVITYTSGTDLSGVASDGSGYTLWDRGSANPSFVTAKITGAQVSGNQVTLTITTDTEATAERSRNTVGAMTTQGWYIDSSKRIYFGEEDSTDSVTGETYYANTTGRGYITRENLDLVLCHGTDPFADGLKLTDGAGAYIDADRWLQALALNAGRLETVLLDVNAVVSRNTGTSYVAPGYVKFNGQVPVAVGLPNGYNSSKRYPLVIFVTGAGTSYWEEYDAGGNVIANNSGTNIYYDNAVHSWLDKEVIVASPHVHSSDNTSAAHEVAAVVELLSKTYSIDADHVIFIGNSNGTLLLSETVRLYPELARVFFVVNGNFGEGTPFTMSDSLAKWTEEEIQAVANHGLCIWWHRGEADSHIKVNQDEYTKLLGYYKAAGHSDAWIADNLRISAYMSWNFKYWGESDHSCTRLLWWFYPDALYQKIYENQNPLPVGSVYKLTVQEDFDYAGAENFEYKVYGESVQAWGSSTDRKTEDQGSSDTGDDKDGSGSGSSGCTLGSSFGILALGALSAVVLSKKVFKR